jgi:hypothetical protein
MPTYYHNETLFSEIYLEEITRQAENADVLASLKVLGEYREYADTHNLKAWKESYVHEVLSALGFYAQSNTQSVTYLFPMGNNGAESPLSLCYVVLPNENLDNTTIGRNWAEKIIRALREKDLQWGLLTNGKQWRIYHQDEPTPYETYLEIDLEAILKEKAKEAYQIFHKFMKAENFAVQEDGKCQFDRFKKESQDKIDYIEKELANALKQREEGGKGVLSDLCMGYVEELRHRNEGNLDDEDLRKKIYHGAMLYMFRLLFLFYADARGLLSDENHELLAKVEGECRARHDGDNLSTPDFQIWDSLERIFVDIDQTYNGGLFSPQESEFTRFLSDTRIGDAYLTNVVFNLTTYHEKNGHEKPISYRDMSVRHLGTLYEGLLEHKLFIAAEDTEVKVAKGKIQFIPASKGGKLVLGHYIKAGEVYFAGDPTERKSTGSYYTPEYIVDYIVRNTVGEKLKELKVAFIKEQKPTLEAFNKAVDDDERHSLAILLEENALAFVREKLLDLSVLDPAMGSGHFLVNATNLISNYFTEILNEIDIQGNLESGTSYWRRWVVENCIYGVDLNPLAVELAKLSIWILSMAKNQPLSFMNHHLKCGNSLLGTRFQEMDVSLNHETNGHIHQLGLFENDTEFLSIINKVTDSYHMIASKGSVNLEDVQEKKAWLSEIEENLAGYKAICDIYSGAYLGDPLSTDEIIKLVMYKDFTKAYKLHISNVCFHWELEFPEVLIVKSGFDVVVANPPYLGEKGNKTTFDIIKNGYLSKYYYGKMDLFYFFFHLALDVTKKNSRISFITTNYFLTADGAIKLRNDLKKRSTIFALINFNTLNIFFSATGQHNLITILTNGTDENINALTCVTDRTGLATSETLRNIFDRNDSETNYFEVPQKRLFDSSQNIIRLYEVSSSSQTPIFEILNRMRQRNFDLLGEIANVNIGLLTGADKVSQKHIDKYKLSSPEFVKGTGIFVIDKYSPLINKLNEYELSKLRPFYKNSDIYQFYTKENNDLLLIDLSYPECELLNPALVPNLYKHLSQFKEILQNRKSNDNGLQAVIKKGLWWQFSKRLLDFSQPKIVAPQRSSKNVFGYNEITWYASGDVYFITSKNSSIDLKFVLALLNSKIYYLWLYYMGKRKGNSLELYQQPLSQVPIPHVDKIKQKELVELSDKLINLLKNLDITNNPNVVNNIYNQVNRCIYDIFSFSKLDIEIIEETYSSITMEGMSSISPSNIDEDY